MTFTPADAVNYNAATASVQINVLKATPAVTWPTPADIVYGTALSATQLNATADAAGTFVYTPAAGAMLNAGAAQTLSVTFTPADANYNAVTKTVSINVLKATTTLTWTTPADIVYGTALGATQLNATASVAGTFAYTPSAGTVLMAGAGQTLSVTFTPSDAGNYAPATTSVLINVLKATPVVTWATPANFVYGAALGAAQLNATANVPGAFVYTPAAGAILNAGPQTLSVTFTPTDSANYAAATKTVTVAVLQATPAITWNTPADITLGTALSATQLDATTIVAGTFVYTPAADTILPVGVQTLSVTFTPTDAVNYTTATKTVAINVRGDARITVDKTTVGVAGTVTAFVADGPGKPSDWVALYVNGASSYLTWKYLNGAADAAGGRNGRRRRAVHAADDARHLRGEVLHRLDAARDERADQRRRDDAQRQRDVGAQRRRRERHRQQRRRQRRRLGGRLRRRRRGAPELEVPERNADAARGRPDQCDRVAGDADDAWRLRREVHRRFDHRRHVADDHGGERHAERQHDHGRAAGHRDRDDQQRPGQHRRLGRPLCGGRDELHRLDVSEQLAERARDRPDLGESELHDAVDARHVCAEVLRRQHAAGDEPDDYGGDPAGGDVQRQRDRGGTAQPDYGNRG